VTCTRSYGPALGALQSRSTSFDPDAEGDAVVGGGLMGAALVGVGGVGATVGGAGAATVVAGTFCATDAVVDANAVEVVVDATVVAGRVVDGALDDPASLVESDALGGAEAVDPVDDLSSLHPAIASGMNTRTRAKRRAITRPIMYECRSEIS
jgi:hypothetical protein